MIYDLIDLSSWKSVKDCLNELKSGGIGIDERQLRKLVKANNISFINHEVDTFIAHSQKGYKATRDRNEILASINDKYKRAINMLNENSRVIKAMNENDNERFEL